MRILLDSKNPNSMYEFTRENAYRIYKAMQLEFANQAKKDFETQIYDLRSYSAELEARIVALEYKVQALMTRPNQPPTVLRYTDPWYTTSTNTDPRGS